MKLLPGSLIILSLIIFFVIVIAPLLHIFGTSFIQAEGKNIRLPHLIRGGLLKKTGLRGIPFGLLFRLFDQMGFVKGLSDRLRTGLQKKDSPQDLGDASGAFGRVLLFEFKDFFDRPGKFLSAASTTPVFEALFPVFPVKIGPSAKTAERDPCLLVNQLSRIAFLQQQLDDPKSFLE